MAAKDLFFSQWRKLELSITGNEGYTEAQVKGNSEWAYTRIGESKGSTCALKSDHFIPEEGQNCPSKCFNELRVHWGQEGPLCEDEYSYSRARKHSYYTVMQERTIHSEFWVPVGVLYLNLVFLCARQSVYILAGEKLISQDWSFSLGQCSHERKSREYKA